MNMDFFLPPGADGPDPATVLHLPQNSLTHACMWPSFKRLTGWRGLAACTEESGAWTCRINARDGVYGIAPEGPENRAGWLGASFGIHYFPTSTEPLLECYAPATAMITADPDYRTAVRAFVDYPALRHPFRVARLVVATEASKRALVLRLEGFSQRRTISATGIKTPDGAWIVPPGACEEDVPAFALARDLIHVLTAAITFGAGAPPTRFVRTLTPDVAWVRSTDGTVTPLASNDITVMADSFAWGAPEATAWLGETTTELPGDAANDLCWKLHDPAALATDGTGSVGLDTRPDLTVLTGFLGSGKTTVINQMIEYYRSHDQFVAVIQNEIGASGVDQHLVDGGDSTIALDEGCVCCTLSGALTHGIHHLIERFHPEHILLETSGLANPLNLLAEINQIEEVARLSAVITVIDAANAAAILPTSELARDQVRGADAIVINKCDLMTDSAIDALCRYLRGINPRAPMLRISDGKVNPALLLSDGRDAARGMPAFEASHHAAHAAEGYSAVRIAQPKPFTRRDLSEMLARAPESVFRVKGILKLADSPEVEVLQCVGRRHELTPLASPYDGEPFLVFIGQDMDEPALRARLAGSQPPTKRQCAPQPSAPCA